MNLQTKKCHCVLYTCFFCKTNIKSSKKTEIFYRSEWIKGCHDCFALSIDLETAKNFQLKDY